MFEIQKTNLGVKSVLFDELWLDIKMNHPLACVRLPNQFVWKTGEFKESWVEFRDMIDVCGFDIDYPERSKVLIMIVILALRDYECPEIIWKRVFEQNLNSLIIG